ncbi:MAG: hypothetical protein HYZ50_24675 [Deltaproteobacteria bacterium]|nr:hypothetical protein [Deltaproteobacteria bacterium]
MQFRRQSTGHLITLDDTKPVGRGGEGSVYAVPDDKAVVAKIYLEPTETRARKLAAMVAVTAGEFFMGC